MGFYNVVNPNLLVAGQSEDISQVLSNLNAIAAVLNGGIDNANISPTAAIAYAKLNLALAVKNSDISDAAAIEGHKVAWHVGTSPPASPQTGDIWIYPFASTSFTVACYQMYIYDNSEATYKWKFVGGTPLWASEGSTVGTSGSGFLGGISLTVPRAGDYIVGGGCNGHATSIPGNTIVQWGVSVRNSGLVARGGVGEFFLQSPSTTGTVGMHMHVPPTLVNLPAGEALRLYASLFGWEMPNSSRYISLIPQRII